MSENKEKLVILWTSGDKEVATNMIFMYALNSKIRGWWEDITLIVWGPSAKLLSEDEELQDYMKKMKEEGIKLEACRACANNYNVSEKLEEMEIEVKSMGQPLTDYILGDYHLITI